MILLSTKSLFVASMKTNVAPQVRSEVTCLVIECDHRNNKVSYLSMNIKQTGRNWNTGSADDIIAPLKLRYEKNFCTK